MKQVKFYRMVLKRLAAITVLRSILIVMFATNAWACTAVYVGPKVSEDGTVMIAKSNDCQQNFANYVTVEERVENVPGRTMPINNSGTVTTKIPDTTFRYTAATRRPMRSWTSAESFRRL